MLLTVDEFCHRVESEMDGLVDDLQRRTGRFGDAEKQAWERSLGKVDHVLRGTRLSGLHVQLNPPSSVSVEYRLPASASWCDIVLLGRRGSRPAALLMELKDWDTTGDEPGPRPGLIVHKGDLTLHPSEQLRGYVEYCRRFHSAVRESDAEVGGCVFMTGTEKAVAYRVPPHEALTSEYPLFSACASDLEEQLPRYLESQFSAPDPSFAADFESGTYSQDRNFILQVAAALQNPENERFVLLDHQRLGFERCLAAADRVLSTSTGKGVVVIEGPPGSGKSVLAANLWAELARHPKIGKNVVFTTTSAAHKTNWKAIFDQLSGGPAGRGIVVPANQFNPGLTPEWALDMQSHGEKVTIENWRKNLALFASTKGRSRIANDSIAVSIVDEAHALIDPTVPGKKGVAPSGWSMHAGPQAWHVMRASRLSIFLLDSEQSYRENETTKRAALDEWARDHGVDRVETVSLEESQFRCAGSKEYVDWLDELLELRSTGRVRTDWRRRGDQGAFVFEVVKDPGEIDERLREKLAKKRTTARIVASYARKWSTRYDTHPHTVPDSKKDFVISYERGGESRKWTRIWNYAPDQDYTLWVQAPEGSAMDSDPLCEVGCPYVVRGFDYDYLGILWLSDLVWRDNGWRADPSHVHESAWRRIRETLKSEKKKDVAPEAMRELVRRLQRGYRILFSRAIRGVYVWFEDVETRRRVEAALGSH